MTIERESGTSSFVSSFIPNWMWKMMMTRFIRLMLREDSHCLVSIFGLKFYWFCIFQWLWRRFHASELASCDSSIMKADNEFHCSCQFCVIDWKSPLIIKTRFRMSAMVTSEGFDFFCEYQKCRTNLCWNMDVAQLSKAIKMICSTAEMFASSFGKLSGSKGCDYASFCLRPVLLGLCCKSYVITVKTLSPNCKLLFLMQSKFWWIHFSHEWINYNIRTSMHVPTRSFKLHKPRTRSVTWGKLWFRWKYFDMTFFLRKLFLSPLLWSENDFVCVWK